MDIIHHPLSFSKFRVIYGVKGAYNILYNYSMTQELEEERSDPLVGSKLRQRIDNSMIRYICNV